MVSQKNTHRHQRVVVVLVQATLIMGKQSERLNKAAQQRKESNYTLDIYNEILFPPSIMEANTRASMLFNM